MDLLDPGPLAYGAGEAVPALGESEPYDAARHAMVDTVERPTTISVRASEQRLHQLHNMGLLQSGVDAGRSMKARTSVEKMLCHQLAAAHVAAMNLLGFMPGLQGRSGVSERLPIAEIARLGNTAARLMDAFAAGCQAFSKMKTGRDPARAGAAPKPVRIYRPGSDCRIAGGFRRRSQS